MCLAIPGCVETIRNDDAGMRMADVCFGGVRREVCLEYVPEAAEGDYVLVHVGFALGIVDEAEARRTYAALRELGQLDELSAPDEREAPASGGTT
ncbi:MAG: HypC/HybG/HupF family hydrogenase formation chaperone [Myxococcales bacterium]|nr:HypC/HybG/HupF family hydrogenase formation chaperone [Myxococcales bacterium]